MVGGGSVIITYTPPPIGTLHLDMTTGSQLTLTTTGDYNTDTTGLNTYIYDTSAAGGPQLLTSCTTALTCSWAGTPTEQQTTYFAVAAPPYTGTGIAPGAEATSDTVTAPLWTASLGSSGNSFTATTNYAVDNSGIAIEIYDLSQSGYPRVASCLTGASCTITTNNIGHQYVAAAGPSTNAFGSGTHFVTTNTVSGVGPTAAHETVGGSNPAELGMCYACTADPVNTWNGEFFENSTDLSIPGRGPGLAITRSYSSQLATKDGLLGYGWSFNYGMSVVTNPTGSVDIRQENGSVVTFTPDANGAYQAPARVLATLTHNANGSWTYTRRAREIFSFTSTGLLNSLSDLNGNTTTLARNTQGQITTATDGSGRNISFTYNDQGRIWSIQYPSGQHIWYNYDPAGRLTGFSDRNSGYTSYGYNDLNQLTTFTDPRWTTMTNTYDAVGRVTSQTDRAGGITTFDYATDGTTTVVSPGGRITAETYTNGQLVRKVQGVGTPSAATWIYAYDQNTFQTTQVTDPLGHSSTATYDSAGNQITASDADGNQQSWTYDAIGDRTSATDANGTKTTSTWDTSGNLLSTSTPLSGASLPATTTYAHTDTSHPGDTTSVTDPDGNTTTLSYTPNGDLASNTNPLGNTTTYTYDALGQRLTTVTPSGKTTTYTYDEGGRLLSSTDPLGNTIASFTYDANNNRTRETDGNGNTTLTTYDYLNRPTNVYYSDGASTTTGYDPDGNQTTQTDANGHTTTYTYDALNRLTQRTDPLNRSIQYGYDAAGHLTAITDTSGRNTTNSYDHAGHRTGTTYSDGITHAETLTYTPIGRQASTTDGTGTTTNTYDSLGRLTASTNGAGQTTGYTYDLAGHLTALAYPNGQTLTRAYDTAGQLTAITDWTGHTTTFTPDADGNTTSTAYGNGVTATATIDAAGHVSAITDTGPGSTTLASFTYTRNIAGALASANITGITQPAESYSYTSRNQLAAVNTATYTYDPAGNPTRLASGATLAYDAASQPTSYTISGTTTPITHDTQGNRLTGPGPNGTAASYTWNQANQLTNANGATYTYNAAGLRNTRTPAGGTAQHFAWDTRAGVPLMLTDGTTSYLYDDAGNPIEQIDAAGTPLFYQHDQYGSTRILTDTTGTVAATFTYDANGNLTSKTGTADTPLRWNGQAQDTDTGLYYLRARYYDPQTAQFASIDPAAPITREHYTYGSSNPLNRMDPSGLISVGLCPTASVGAMFGGFAQFCLVAAFNDVDASFTVGITGTIGGGVQTPTAAAVLAVQGSTARSVGQLGGPFGYGGLSAREVLDAGAGVFGGKSCGAPGDVVVGGEYNVGLGLAAPIPAEVHGGKSNTWTISSDPFYLWR